MADGNRPVIDRLRGAVGWIRQWIFGRGDLASDSGHSPGGPTGGDPRTGALQQREQEKMDRLVELAEEKGDDDEGSPDAGAPPDGQPDEWDRPGE